MAARRLASVCAESFCARHCVWDAAALGVSGTAGQPNNFRYSGLTLRLSAARILALASLWPVPDDAAQLAELGRTAGCIFE